MANLKKYLISALLCAFLFAILASVIAPSTIKLLFTPPVSFGMNCEPAAAWAMRQLLISQLIALVVGLIFGSIVCRFLSKKRDGEDKNKSV